MQIKRYLLSVLCGVFCLWVLMVASDVWKVMVAFEKPTFAWPTITADDGGSGTYVGVGYSFEIEGNFMPLDSIQGVTSYEFYLFGWELTNGER